MKSRRDWHKASLPALFAKIDPERRGFYARFVEKCSLTSIPFPAATNLASNKSAGNSISEADMSQKLMRTKEADETLRGIAFPRLQVVRLMISSSGCDYVPPIDAAQVVTLELTPAFYYDPSEWWEYEGLSAADAAEWVIDPEELATVLDQVVVCFLWLCVLTISNLLILSPLLLVAIP